jgi:formyltetrahydrofolate deformylase
MSATGSRRERRPTVPARRRSRRSRPQRPPIREPGPASASSRDCVSRRRIEPELLLSGPAGGAGSVGWLLEWQPVPAVVLLISCPDQPGIVARFTDALYRAGANVLSLEQHIEEGEQFYMRIHADTSNLNRATSELEEQLRSTADALSAQMLLRDPTTRQRVAILASREGACLEDLLNKHRAGELACDIELIASNFPDLEPLAAQTGVPFHYLPIAPGNERAQEQQLTELLEQAGVDLVVLARYMKVLSPSFVERFDQRVINIHHGFLPAFKGSRPYHQAWEAGVKIIGATAHFATSELDAGPIIAQDVMPVTHQHTVEQMIRAGRDIERRVLAQAVQAYLDHKIILRDRRTIIFH